MARIYDKKIDKHVKWSGDRNTDFLPVKGDRVEEFIKESLEARIGALYYDTANNRYLAFADNENRDKYLADPTQVQLILGTFDAPFNYSAEINLLTPSYNAVFLGAKGNSIQFTFDVKNKQGASTGENVIIQYTIIRNAVKKVVTATGKAGETITFPVDEYLGEGTNTIIVGITGQTSLAATTSAVTYQVVNLSLSDETDIAIPYDLSTGSKIAEVSFSVSGYGTKVVEWYLDGELIPFVKSEDEVVESATTRTKYIQLSNLQQGTHSLQIRAYTTINGDRFYSDTLYRELIVTTGVDKKTIVAVGYTIPAAYGLADESLTLYGAIQYLPYTFRLAAYSPKNLSEIPITITIDGVNKGVVVASNNIEESFTFTSAKDGNQTVVLATEGVTRQLTAQVSRTTMKIAEITAGLALDFNAMGKSNTAADRAQWTGNGHTATLEGFNWNETSGWVDNLLKMNSGASLSIDYAPLGNNPTELGKTIEIEFRSTNVTDDNAVLCDLRDNGVGLLITATKVALTSQNGTIIETEYKSEEFVRIAFVINRSAGSARKNLTFIYANGCVSRCQNWASTDSYTSPVELRLQATEGAEIELKSIRVYDAALNDDQILNNYNLYRDTIEEMVEIYNRNDIYAEGTVAFAPDKMVSRLPVMIVTGDIPTLENTSDKDTQIVVDIEYNNLQNPKKSFKMVGAAMRPQGTSSMGYPKKNFRIYTNKLADTILYDADGNTVADKLYSFKDNAIPVDCWCLKADYAESSGTHNTGIARMWNKALMDGQIDGEYVFRTDAQKAAIAAGYKYDVRTTIDGFPILLFYRPTAGDEPIFIGKYNFNNDKSTENVFGFTGIPGFDNSRMQCWEVLNNGNPIGLFTDIDDFYRTVQSEDGLVEGWQLAFEARYPDKSTDTLDLYDFAQWVNGIKDDHTRFATEKWSHLNVYMMAAYYCYLMRHAAADQFVKNAMLTSEDGQHFYFILYDNDTINGLINTGAIDIEPTDDRQTLDKSGTYKFAGHDSVLWNMLEADEEFMNLVKTVDNALYSVGISYTNAIRMFDQEQADKWVERVYNQDSEYKYVGPYSNQGINNLFMLQGKRDLHRRWWLAKRFSIYDAKFVSGEYKSQAIELKCQNGTEPGLQMKVTAGYPLDYGYGINNLPRKSGVTLNVGESTTFVTEETVNLGDPIRIYGAPNIAELDISQMVDRLAVVTIANVYAPALGTKLRKLIIGNPNKQNLEVSEISGLTNATLLEYLDIRNMKGMTSLNLTHQKTIKYVDATGSSVASIEFAKGAPLTQLGLPASFRSLVLEDLPQLQTSGITFENFYSINNIKIINCGKLLSDFNWVYSWYNNKTSSNNQSSLHLEGIAWKCSASEFINLCNIKKDGGSLVLKGKVSIGELSYEEATKLMDLFGDTVFSPSSELFINAPSALFIVGETSVLEGASTKYSLIAIGKDLANTTWSVNPSNNYVSMSNDGVLTTIEGLGVTNLVIAARATSTEGEVLMANINVETSSRTYPSSSNVSIVGPDILNSDRTEYKLVPNAGYNGTLNYSWAVTGSLASYVTLEPTDDVCIVNLTNNITTKVDGAIEVTIYKRYNSQSLFKKTMSISAINENIAETDPTVCSLLYNAGYTATSAYVTKQEAAAITQSMFDSITFKSKSIKSFNGLRYFTKLTSLKNTCFNSCTSLKSIVIPEGVTSLGSSCFSNCGNLTSVNIPEGVTSLPQNCFYGCYGLKSITIPEGVTSLGTACFQGCTELHSVTLPSTVTYIDSYCFSSCNRLASINIPEGVTSLPKSCFYKCVDLPPLTIPSTVTQLGDECFSNCWSFTSITIPEGVTSIGIGCFSGCTALTSITIPEGVTSIGNMCFSGCGNLNISVDKNNNNYLDIDGVLFSKDTTTLLSYAKDIKEPQYVVPNSVTSIGSHCFAECKSLTSITIPEGVTSLGNRCFYRCYELHSITIPDSVTSIGEYCFYECKSLISITIPSTVTSLNVCCFQGCTVLTSVTLHEGLTTLGDSCFMECRSLTSITIPSTVTRLGVQCFRGCSVLPSIIIPEGVTYIGSYCFSECYAITSVNIPNGVKTLNNYCFSSCTSLTSVNISEGVTYMNEGVFKRCSSLTSITIPRTVTTLTGFSECTALTSITIHEGVTTFSASCFESCSSLASITIPSTVTSLGMRCFERCMALKEIRCLRATAPSATGRSTFGEGGSSYTGCNTYNTGENVLYVPQGATGYDTGQWLDPLQNAEKCGFTLSATL